MTYSDQILIKIIEYKSIEYDRSLDLRHRILRLPLGLSLFEEDLASDADDVHIAAFANTKLLGIMLLKPLGNNTVKMRQVAIDDGYKASGIGTKLIAFAENYCRQNNINTITLNARETAVAFYKKNQYHVVSDVFYEVGIRHFKMKKTLVE